MGRIAKTSEILRYLSNTPSIDPLQSLKYLNVRCNLKSMAKFWSLSPTILVNN